MNITSLRHSHFAKFIAVAVLVLPLSANTATAQDVEFERFLQGRVGTQKTSVLERLDTHVSPPARHRDDLHRGVFAPKRDDRLDTVFPGHQDVRHEKVETSFTCQASSGR